MNIEKHLALLGMQVEDLVTTFQGCVTAVSFDLFGCIQVIVNPGIDKNGQMQEVKWLDVSRLKILDARPLMPRPNFFLTEQQIAAGEKGPSERPASNKV